MFLEEEKGLFKLLLDLACKKSKYKNNVTKIGTVNFFHIYVNTEWLQKIMKTIWKYFAAFSVISTKCVKKKNF